MHYCSYFAEEVLYIFFLEGVRKARVCSRYWLLNVFAITINKYRKPLMRNLQLKITLSFLIARCSLITQKIKHWDSINI